MIRWIIKLLKSPSLIAFGVVALFLVIAVFAAFDDAIGWNNQGQMRTGIYPSKSMGDNGRYFVKTTGYYFRGFAQQEKIWPFVATLSIGSYEGKGDDIKDSDVPRTQISFAGAAKADQSALFRFDLPRTKEEMFAIWDKYPGAYPMLVRKGLLPEAQTALRTAANLMEPEEALNNISQFRDKVADQMQYGLLKTYTEIKEFQNEAGETEHKQFTREKTDKDGNKLRVDLKFKELGIAFSQVEVSLPVFDPDVNTALVEHRQQTLNAETAKKRRIAAEQDKLAAKAEGEARVIKAELKVQEEHAATVATARLELERDSLNAVAAEYQKQEKILKAQGIAEGKRLVMEADGYKEKMIEADVEKTKILADAIRESKVPWVPEIVFINGGGKGASRVLSGTSALETMAQFMSVESAGNMADKIQRRGAK